MPYNCKYNVLSVIKYNISFQFPLADAMIFGLYCIYHPSGSLDRSFMVDPLSLSLVPASAPTTGVTKAVVCAILSVGWCI